MAWAPRGRWLLAALVLSLGLNLFLGGFLIGGRLVASRFAGRDWAPHRLQAVASQLPPADARILRERIAGSRAELRPLMDDLRKTKDELGATLIADPLDKARFEAQMTQARQQREAIGAALSRGLQSALETMSAEGRAAFARNYRSVWAR